MGRDRRDLRALKEYRVRLVRRERLVQREHWDRRDLKALKEKRVRLVRKERLVQREHWDLQEHWDLRGRKVHKGCLAKTVLRAHKVRRALEDC